MISVHLGTVIFKVDKVFDWEQIYETILEKVLFFSDFFLNLVFVSKD